MKFSLILYLLEESGEDDEKLRFLGRTDNVRLVRLVRERIEKDKVKRQKWIEELVTGMTTEEAREWWRRKPEATE
jgi:hypothetical protein